MILDEIIKVVTAFKEGKPVQFRFLRHDGSAGCWQGVPSTFKRWDFTLFEFRIKPQPRVFWANEYREKGGSVYLGSFHTTEQEAKYNVNSFTVAGPHRIELPPLES